MGKKADKVLADVRRINETLLDMACGIGGTDVSKAAASDYGISRKEARAILFGMMQGLTAAIVVNDPTYVPGDDEAERFEEMVVLDSLAEYREFRDAGNYDRIVLCEGEGA